MVRPLNSGLCTDEPMNQPVDTRLSIQPQAKKALSQAVIMLMLAPDIGHNATSFTLSDVRAAAKRQTGWP